MAESGDMVRSLAWGNKSFRLNATAYYPKGGAHWAWDVSTPTGTKLYAPVDGVILDFNDGVSNNGVHGSGSPSNWITLGVEIEDKGEMRKATVLFQHMSPGLSDKVKRGDAVPKGTYLGRSGYSGNVSPPDASGAHLHIAAMWGWREEGDRYIYIDNAEQRIFPPSEVWKGVTGTPEGDTGTTDETTQTQESISLYAAGDFSKVKEAYSSQSLRDAVFNPPPIKYWSNSAADGTPTQMERILRDQRTLNRPGFIVRDPLFMGEQRAAANDQTHQNRNDAKKNSDPDSGGGQKSSDSWLTFNTNYGFRFLYNPSTYNEGYSSVSGADPFVMLKEVTTMGQAVVGASGASVGLQLFLYRRMDVELLRWAYSTGKVSQIDFSTLYGEDVKEPVLRRLMERGTMVDIEQLFRLCNGDPQDTWHGRSSDWGAIMPTMIALSIGDGPSSRKMRGMLTGISFNHVLFASGMVPVLTELTLTVNRIVDQYYQPFNNAPSINLNGAASAGSRAPSTTPGPASSRYGPGAPESPVPDDSSTGNPASSRYGPGVMYP